MQKMSDDSIKICPVCSEEKVIRLVSAAGFQLKGTGWYATDFKDKGKPGKKSESVGAEKTSVKTSTSAVNSTPSSTEKKGESN